MHAICILCNKRSSEAIEPMECLLSERIDVVHMLYIDHGLRSGAKLARNPDQFLDPVSYQPALKHVHRIVFAI